MALAQVAAVAWRVTVPVVGMGGVSSGRDALELLHAGATLVAWARNPSATRRRGARITGEARELAVNWPIVTGL